MDDIEIYLNMLEDEKNIYAEISNKTDCKIADSKELADYLDNLSGDVKFKLYISDEDTDNDTVAEVTTAFDTHCKNSYEFIGDEFLNLIDEEGHFLPVSKPRTLIHRDGDLHPAVHVWIIKEKDMGVYVLLQKRSAEKAVHPNCYDVSSAGHVPQGEEFRISAIRETAEELGINLHEGKLEFLGTHKSCYNNGDIHDNEIRAVYLCREKIDTDNLVLQASEVSDVVWTEVDELLASVDNENFANCIDCAELFMIKKAVF
ncbi:MAG: NUDIX domain-containing protein [Ruminococcus sp.]|nr:NUDIX domain-containing protein [Ruminococcus sp.]